MPDTDFEACPVGTMDAMQQALDILDHNASIRTEPINTYKFREKLRAILKAHRERMGEEPRERVLIVGDGTAIGLRAKELSEYIGSLKPGPESYALETFNKFPDVSIPDKQLTPIEYARTLKKSRRVK